jgi:hypothetical protein
MHLSGHTVSYFKIVFSVLTGFSVNFTITKQAVGIYLGTCEDMYQSKVTMIVEVFDCVKIRMDIVCISGGARTMEHRTI